ncbi:ImmA/IrrE family metallo-endopeptidase [Heyndrickxia sp. FSL W8-0496]|uniref:ImmA/IrrE family metallo-endopeptidase n=1 Tax=Heyndrickxia sp. FSL W8-0496 TaxID=2954702 RepID=UPI0030F8B72A
MLPDDVVKEITETACELYESIKPLHLYTDDKFFLQYNSINAVKILLKHNEIHLHKKNFRLDSFSGLLFIDELGSTIVVNENHISSRQLFTVAHELGHFYLHRNLQSEFLDNGTNENIYSKSGLIIEQQANLFASEILVPNEVLEKMLKYKVNFFKIAKTIGISLEALKWRIFRYIETKYELVYNFTLMLIEDFKEKSRKQLHDQAYIFDMCEDKYVQFEIFEALCGRESYISNYRKYPKKEMILF